MVRYTLSTEKNEPEKTLDERIKMAKLISFLQKQSVKQEEKLKSRGLCVKHRIYLTCNGTCDLCE